MLRYMLLCPFLLMGLAARAGDLTVLFGTDSNPDSHGIYRIQFDAETGKWAGRVELAAPLRSAGFQALHPGLPVLYTAGMLPG